MPKRLNNEDTDMTAPVKKLVEELTKKFPEKPVALIDERFTSSIAHQTMIDGGMSKKNRRVKGNVDKISATLILQSYMESKR
jgi:putative Holliday junction resolvase